MITAASPVGGTSLKRPVDLFVRGRISIFRLEINTTFHDVPGPCRSEQSRAKGREFQKLLKCLKRERELLFLEYSRKYLTVDSWEANARSVSQPPAFWNGWNDIVLEHEHHQLTGR